MTPFDAFIESLSHLIPVFSVWWLVKFLFVIGLALYVAFAVIIVRQVGLMAKTLDGEFGIPLKLISLIHLGVAVVAFLLALVIL